jgi:hypothetical protein
MAVRRHSTKGGSILFAEMRGVGIFEGLVGNKCGRKESLGCVPVGRQGSDDNRFDHISMAQELVDLLRLHEMTRGVMTMASITSVWRKSS